MRLRAAHLRYSCLALLGVSLLTGCQSGTRRQENWQAQQREPLDPEIVSIHTFFGNNPFLSFDDEGDPNPEGIKVNAFYAVSARTGQGAHADGLIRFKLYAIQRPPDKEPYGELVRTWEFDPQRARDWRATRPTYMGWGYQFQLNWGDADISGMEIRLVPEFVRIDGQVLRGAPRTFRVPRRRESIRLIDVPLDDEPPEEGGQP